MQRLKVWMDACDLYSPSIHRIANKFKEFAPESMIEFVDDWVDADLCVDILIGSPHREELVHPFEESFSNEVVARLELPICKNAYFLCCNIKNDDFFKKAWAESVVSASYLDVPKILGESSSFMRMPLGVDTADFLLPIGAHPKEFLCYAWGASSDPEDEYIKTLYEACRSAGGKLLHSGINYEFDNGKHYVFVPPAKTAKEVSERYSRSWFANAMRKEDGFELANVEAPLSNCMPITLNRECYTNWFNDTSIFVEPGAPELIADIFKQKERFWKITPEFKAKVLERFNWRDIVDPFWKRVLG